MADRHPSERAGLLLDVARRRSSSGLRGRLDDLRVVWPAIVQTALAAALAWLLARHVVGHASPFFAPVAAIITLGVTYGQRAARALEISLGVATGVLIAELTVTWLGQGAAQIGLVVGVAMVAAVLLGGRRLVVTQAAVSASLIATASVPSGITLSRFVDALCGGAAGLLVGLVLLPVDPVRLARRARPALVDALATTLEDVRRALLGSDHDAAVDALGRARGLDALVAEHAEGAEVGRQVARGSPLRRRSLEAIEREAQAAVGLDLAVRGTRALARGTLRAVDTSAHIPPVVEGALDDLVRAVRLLGEAIDDPGSGTDAARAAALAAARGATEALELTGNLSLSAIVSQIRVIATDLLRALGAEEGDATQAVRSAAPGI